MTNRPHCAAQKLDIHWGAPNCQTRAHTLWWAGRIAAHDLNTLCGHADKHAAPSPPQLRPRKLPE